MDHLVANLLNQYLGKYVQNLDSDNLSVSIFRGKASLLLPVVVQLLLQFVAFCGCGFCSSVFVCGCRLLL